MSVYDDPTTPLVALSGGPQNRRWFFYADWLALRDSSRRGRYPLHHHCAVPRCYLPTDRMAVNTNSAITDKYGPARTWTWVEPAQWSRWGREYLTPEELVDHEERPAA
ncbi:hypothetical protein [Umezawaea tangerina]|uniref:Uncharacterized protein n=1 Tax=Umezawaea tangerina TaxID=84725 RepID=A0A2T0SS74_9PSEU|nr:hypothetical protein [Umezawaea tangerina]PRY36265.1 hypothetical protein CLV43_112192 [Umezawaea tangerina]